MLHRLLSISDEMVAVSSLAIKNGRVFGQVVHSPAKHYIAVADSDPPIRGMGVCFESGKALDSRCHLTAVSDLILCITYRAVTLELSLNGLGNN